MIFTMALQMLFYFVVAVFVGFGYNLGRHLSDKILK